MSQARIFETRMELGDEESRNNIMSREVVGGVAQISKCIEEQHQQKQQQQEGSCYYYPSLIIFNEVMLMVPSVLCRMGDLVQAGNKETLLYFSLR